ncbi:MAG: penicillin-binding protein 2 [Natronospirillum sp.]|uniref:peptidoglycan D,D-transpeptidase FtsI family protein n=1 Tax=Natronospirillum sp. TaxID=2812955 RepID=UPI0025EF3EBA|nr:penicillin-binding protein 2 [Natronospirillum sp.]MCH8551329.1 penicillin-binding protein 2 [Natronospirillum sp.]
MTARWRLYMVVFALLLLFSSLLGRVVYLQVAERQFLINQGQMRSAREVEVGAHRGMILDRHGTPLAVSTPVISLWGDPRRLNPADLPRLAEAAGVSVETLEQRHRIHRAFFYVRRQLPPDQANAILDLGIPGVYGRQEYRRYYPAGEVTAHILGFTNIDDHGQEGIELAYNDMLSGRSGSNLVLQNLNGQVVRHVEAVRPPQPGQDLQLTIDLDLQYKVYRALKSAWQRHQADWASVVVMDPRTGDILAMANQPSYNPNDRSSIRPEFLRNRAITDAVEPGSVMKTMAIAGALNEGVVTASDRFDTSPGRMTVGRDHVVRDFRDYGELDVTGIMAHSSNVGMTQIALALGGERLWSSLYRFGFGQPIGVGFPGEATGSLPNYSRWADVQVATQSYGYGMTATPLQLAQAYSAIANDGVMVPPRLLQQSIQSPPTRVMPQSVMTDVRRMLEAAMQDGGTGTRARMPLFSAAGKTGTAHTVGLAGYDEDAYRGVFVGYAPADNPELVVSVVINNPRGEEYFGGAVAGPVFSEVMQAALAHIGTTPDQLLTAGQRGGAHD